MAKFNTKTKTASTKTVNRAGGEAYKQDDKLSLASLLATSFVQDQFYRSASAQIKEAAQLIASIDDKLFAAKAAIFARREMGMRSISHVVAGEIGAQVKGEEWTKDFFYEVVARPDDMLEILAYYWAAHGEKRGGKDRPIPNAMKKGFARRLEGLSGYHLSKYNRSSHDVSLVDVVNLVRPKSTGAIDALMNGTLGAANTWEARMTKAGQEGSSKAKEWAEMVNEGSLGYFALLRNLRNIAQEAPEVIDEAVRQLSDEGAVKRSRVLPFRFTTAVEAIKNAGLRNSVAQKIIAGISEGLDKSLSNVPELDGDTLVVLDESGSMRGKPAKIGSLFAAVLVKALGADLVGFSNNARVITPNFLDSTLTIAESLERNMTFGGTNFKAPFDVIEHPYDRMIFLSDMQGWVGYKAPTSRLESYENTTGAKPYIYSFDLQGYGSVQFPNDRTVCLGGFSSKVFDVMALLESDKNAFVNEIESITF